MLSIVSILISATTAWATLVKSTTAELSVISWEVLPEEPEGTYLKVSAAVSNTGDKQLIIVAAGSKVVRRGERPPLPQARAREPQGAGRVHLESGKIGLVEVFVPVSKAMLARAETEAFAAEFGSSACDPTPHVAVVVEVLLFGVDGDYRAARSPVMCIYVGGGKVTKVRKLRGSGKAQVLPFESYTF